MFKLYTFGPFRLDPIRRKVWRGEVPVPLTGKQFDVLHAIVRHEGKVAERKAIFEEVWPGDQSDLSLRLSRHVADVRQILRRDSNDPNYLENVSGQGYFIGVPVGTIVPKEEGGPPPIQRSSFVRTRLLLGAAAVLLTLVSLTTYVYSRHEGLPVFSYRPLTNDGRPKAGPLLSDGHRLIFREQIGDKWTVANVPFSGGEVSPIDIPIPVASLSDISTDGSMLLFSTYDGANKVISWPLNGGSPLIVTQHASTGSWAPDRDAIAFGGSSSLVVANSGGRTASFAPQFTEVEHPRWHPDGLRIGFTLADLRNRKSTLWQADRNGQHWQRIAQTPSNDEGHGIWTADGRRFLFEAGPIPTRDLWMINGSDKPVRLTDGPFNWTWPLPAKSGDRVFSVGESRRGELNRLDQHTGVWSPYLNGIASYELDFSRDGSWIAYTRYPDHTIWKSRIDGSDPTQLTPPEIEAHQPHWSPVDGRIAFMGHKSGEPWRVFIVDSATKSLVQPIPFGEDQGVPTWSKDGHGFIFGERLLVKDHREMKIQLFDEQSGHLSPLPGSSNLWTARWSPDGDYISALRPNGTALLVSRCCSGEWKAIFEGLDLDDSMWSRDSKSVFLMAATGPGRRQLIRVQIADGRVEKLADISSFPVTDEQWFGLGPDGSVLGLRGASSQEIYALDYRLR
jgi:Tol biopolymer transport system component/DNA-binding winged helix-turn-helix (wHTH) protein